MTAEEKLARELYRVGTIAGNPHRRADELETWESRPETVKTGFMAAAKHVFRRERAAVRRATKYRKAIVEHMVRVTTERSAKQCVCRSCLTHVNYLARVVAVPRKGGRRG